MPQWESPYLSTSPIEKPVTTSKLFLVLSSFTLYSTKEYPNVDVRIPSLFTSYGHTSQLILDKFDIVEEDQNKAVLIWPL